MTFTKITLTSAAALMMGVSLANADMILREDASGNKIVVNTETEQEARIYGTGGDSARPVDCEAGGFYTMMDNDREVYASCDDEKMRFSARVDAATDGAEAASSTTAPGSTSMDQPLEPYAPDTIGGKS